VLHTKLLKEIPPIEWLSHGYIQMLILVEGLTRLQPKADSDEELPVMAACYRSDYPSWLLVMKRLPVMVVVIDDLRSRGQPRELIEITYHGVIPRQAQPARVSRRKRSTKRHLFFDRRSFKRGCHQRYAMRIVHLYRI
jgi:hypothetical protein